MTSFKFSKWQLYAMLYSGMLFILLFTELPARVIEFSNLYQLNNTQKSTIQKQSFWKETIAKNESLEQQLETKQASLDVQFIESAEKGYLMQLLQQENVHNNISEAQFRLGKALTSKLGYQYLPVLWESKAGYHEVGKWVESIERLPYAVIVKRITMKSSLDEIAPVQGEVEMEVPLKN